MGIYLRTARTLSLLFALGITPSVAAPLPVPAVPTELSYSLVQSVREQRAPSRTESAKVWVKTKKDETVRWVDRQKNKLKRLAD